MSGPATSDAPRQNRRWLVTLPLIGFIAVAGLFLLRLHGGELFADFQAISENAVATHLRRSVAEVRQQLRYLHTAGILHYQPRQEAPQALFTTPRCDAPKLPIDQVRMTAARDLARHKTNAVGLYLAGTRCRQRLR